MEATYIDSSLTEIRHAYIINCNVTSKEKRFITKQY